MDTPWAAFTDQATGVVYYYNKVTQESVWVKPADFVSSSPVPENNNSSNSNNAPPATTPPPPVATTPTPTPATPTPTTPTATTVVKKAPPPPIPSSASKPPPPVPAASTKPIITQQGTIIPTSTQPIIRTANTSGKWSARSMLVVCTFPFIGKKKFELSLTAGDEYTVTEECDGWLKGSSSSSKRGIFPAAFVRQINQQGQGLQVLQLYQRERPTHSNPLANEMTMVLREWDVMLKRFYQEKRYVEFNAVKTRMTQLTVFRREILHPNVSDAYRRKVKPIIISKIEEGRRIMGLDMIPRLENGEPADETNTPIMQLQYLHVEMQQRELLAQRRGGKGALKQMKTTATTKDKDNAAAAAAAAASSSAGGARLFQILLDMKACVCPVGENNEIFFTIYEKKADKQQPSVMITEPFVVHLTEYGMPHNVDRIGKLRTIVKDFGPRDLEADLWLVAKIHRKGKLISEVEGAASTSSMQGSKKDMKESLRFRRPFGCAALQLTKELMVQGGEHMMTIYWCRDEFAFPNLHEAVMNKTGNYEIVPRSKGVAMQVKLFASDYATLLEDVPEFKECCVTQKIGFPDVILPGETRNDVYVTLESCEVLQDRKTAPKNVEISMQVLMDTGTVVSKAITPGTGEEPVSEYRSMVYYHSNSPRIGDTVRVNVPLEHFERAHLYFTLRHCSSNESKSEKDKFFSFSYLPLCDLNGTVVKDGQHVVNTFKPLAAASATPSYLVAGESMLMASSPVGPGGGSGGGGAGGSGGAGSVGLLGKTFGGLSSKTKKDDLEMRKGETISVKTHLSSTVLTSNLELSCLLKWKANSSKLVNALDKFSYIEPQELMKFIQEMFHALFGISEEHQGDAGISSACFDAIVKLISVLIDDKSRAKVNRPVLESYIDSHFKSTTAHQTLLKHFLDQFKVLKVAKPEQKQMQNLRAALKTYEYLIKFIIASRLKYLASQKETNPLLDKSFHAEMEKLFAAIREMMTMSTVIAEQTIMFRVFGTVFHELSKFFAAEALCSIVIKFLDASDNIEKRPTLVAEKLVFLRNVVAGGLFVKDESRNLLFPSISKHLKMHMKNVEPTDDKLPSELIQCIPIIVGMVDAIQKNSIEGSGVEKLITFTPLILEGIVSLEEESSSRTELVTCLLALFHLGSDQDLVSFIDGMPAAEKKVFLLNALGAFQSFLMIHTYPDQWYSLCMFQFQVTTKLLRLSASSIRKSCLQPFEADVWEEYFKLCVAVINAKRLQIEQFSAVKRDQLLARYRDMRHLALDYLQDMWKSLGDLQHKFVPELVPPFLQMIRLEDSRLRMGGLDLYFILVEAEFKVTKAFKAVEQRTIDILDQLSNTYHSDEFGLFFTSNLEKKFAQSPAKEASKDFLNDIRQLLEFMTKLRGYPMEVQYEDERSVAILKLMAYLKQTERHDLYVKYVRMLCEMHVHHKNPTEAGMALMLHNEMLKWDGPDKGGRKELLLAEAIDLFDKGRMWERSLSLVKELKVHYDKHYQYRKLADLALKESLFYKNIYEKERFYAEYYRVGYYGMLFPLDYRGKEFVYRGEELEKPADFIARILVKFPNAEVIQNSSEKPGKEIIEGDGQFLQINAVAPVLPPDISGSVDKNGIVMPARARRYAANNGISTFMFSKPFRKGEKSDNEFKDLWIKNTYLEVMGSFPTYTRRLQVKSTREEEVSPIVNAIASVVAKNEELIAKYEQLEEDEADATNLLNTLTMQLNGVVDAAVNGGVFKYRDAFFSAQFIQRNPAEKDKVDKLKDALRNQVQILERGLDIHNRLVPASMRPMQLHLEEFYSKMRSELKQDLSL